MEKINCWCGSQIYASCFAFNVSKIGDTITHRAVAWTKEQLREREREREHWLAGIVEVDVLRLIVFKLSYCLC
jgi:hypothetical protein